MPDSTGLLPFLERFPDRFFDVGIAEQHAITAAAGMAMGGLRPVVALYSTFLTRAIDQLNLDVGLHGQPVVVCLDRAGITGADGPSHHGILDMVLCTKVPGMTVMAPSSYQDLQVMLEDAMAITDGPVSIRWSKQPPRMVGESETGSGLRARKVRAAESGNSGDGAVCILSVGTMLEAAEQAAEELTAAGTPVTLWDVRVCKPLDPDMIADAASHAAVVTVEDGIVEGGVGSMARTAIAERSDATNVRVLGVPVAYIPHGDVAGILIDLGLDGPGIARSAQEALANIAH